MTLINNILQLQKFSSDQPNDIDWSTADVYLEQKLTNGFYINLSDRYLRAISSLSFHVNISIFWDQGHLEQVAEDHVWLNSEHLQGRRLHKYSGQPVPVVKSPLQWKRVF